MKSFNGVLILENVTTEDAGWYACYTNGTKTRIMTGAKLDVDDKSTCALPSAEHILTYKLKGTKAPQCWILILKFSYN